MILKLTIQDSKSSFWFVLCCSALKFKQNKHKLRDKV
jgi:hypothetical protein